MANQEKNKKPNFAKSVQVLVDNLRTATKTSRGDIYGVETDIPSVLAQTKYDEIKKNSERLDTNKILGANLSSSRMNNSNNKPLSPEDDFYNLVRDPQILNQLQNTMSGYNVNFKQLLQDYEVIKRCIPQIHKTIETMKQNIANPDSISKNILGVQFKPNVDQVKQKECMDVLNEIYKIHSEAEKIISNYLIVSVMYIADVPYSKIVDMLTPDENGTQLSESAVNIVNESCNDIATLASRLSTTLTEHAIDLTLTESAEADLLTQEAMSNITLIKGSMSYYRDDILNESVTRTIDRSSDTHNIMKILNTKKSTRNDINNTIDGFISNDTAKKIEKNVKFKGCKSEYLDPSRMVAFDLRGTIVGYFYVEDDKDLNTTSVQSNIMNQINSTIYKVQSQQANNRKSQVENMVIKNVSNKLISCISDKFIVDNMKDIKIIYEFVKEHELHTKKKRVIFFHPDEIVEVKREEGSVLKNCLFMAKLAILTILANTITNATRGGDRTNYYVSTGLTTDIEGHVNKAIAAIKHGQLRYSDLGTVNEVFNVVGSNVDVFIPQSIDGNRPIDAEVMSGQNVDMNTEFLEFLIRNIIISFGMPPAMVDEMNNVDLARTLSMSNLDAAKLFMDAQLELQDPVTKHIRNILRYEFPDEPDVWDVTVTFNTPSVIVREMNRDIISNVQEMAEMISELLIPEEDETEISKKKRLLKYMYIRKCTPTLDWDSIEKILDELSIEYRYDKIRSELNKKETPADMY